MMRSMFSAVSGLKAHQIRMDVIGNNIANVNTVGYKASRMVFADLFSQTSAAASGASETMGGTNARQIGLGVSTGAIDILFGTSAAQTTGRALDLMIDGDGFFVVHDENPIGNITSTDPLNPVPQDGGVRFTRAGNFYIDHEGNLVTADGYKVLGWMNRTDPDDPASDVEGDKTTMPTYEQTQERSLEAIRLECVNGAGEAVLKFDEVAIDSKGVLTAVYTDPTTGEPYTVYIGQLAIASFQNQEGLEKVGNNQYKQTNNTGNVTYSPAATMGTSSLKPGCLEMSNVDLADSFTDMIITQRGFQANSRTITTTDSMLEELVNLKR